MHFGIYSDSTKKPKIDRLINLYMDRKIDTQMEDISTYSKIYKQIDCWIHKWINCLIDLWMDVIIDTQMDRYINLYKNI